MKTWFTVTNRLSAEAADISILDEIGSGGVTATDFASALREIPLAREIVVSINSPGGSVFDGWAIYNLLAARRDRVTCKVIGMAASMASVVMLAGRRVTASDFATIMIHNPAANASGDSRDMREAADLLDKLRVPIVSVYASKSGKDAAAVMDAMDNETWFTAGEAKAWGLVDDVVAGLKVAASFNLTKFKNAPRPDREPTHAIWARQLAARFPAPVPQANNGATVRRSTAEVWAEHLRKGHPATR